MPVLGSTFGRMVGNVACPRVHLWENGGNRRPGAQGDESGGAWCAECSSLMLSRIINFMTFSQKRRPWAHSPSPVSLSGMLSYVAGF